MVRDFASYHKAISENSHMLKINLLRIALVFVLNAAFCSFGVSQDKPPAPPAPPPAKQIKKENATSSQAKLTATMAREVEWKLHSFPEDGFAAMFPRPPVVETEELFEPSFGKINLKIYTSIGDGIVFVIGKTNLPYVVKDEEVARSFRAKALEGVAEEKAFEWVDQKEINIDGRKYLEATGRNKASGGEAVFRAFLAGKGVFYQLAMTVVPEGVDEEEKGIINRGLREDKDRFISSFQVFDLTVPAVIVFVEPIFRGSFENGVFTSEYFDFTIYIPEGWHEIDQADVSGLKEQTKGLMENNSSINLSKVSSTRKNLFMFSSKSLGSDENYMVNCTIVKTPAADVTATQFSQVLENIFGKIRLFKLLNRTHTVTVGKNSYASFDLAGAIGEFKYGQSVYVTVKKGHVLAFSITYREGMKAKQQEIIKSITFSPARLK